jgi:hypothetical protein
MSDHYKEWAWKFNRSLPWVQNTAFVTKSTSGKKTTHTHTPTTTREGWYVQSRKTKKDKIKFLARNILPAIEHLGGAG